MVRRIPLIINSGFKFKDEIPQSNTLQNIKFVITGTINNMSRSQLKSKLEESGANVSSSISSKTDFIIVDDIDDLSDKVMKAKNKDIKVLQKDNFEKIYL